MQAIHDVLHLPGTSIQRDVMSSPIGTRTLLKLLVRRRVSARPRTGSSHSRQEASARWDQSLLQKAFSPQAAQPAHGDVARDSASHADAVLHALSGACSTAVGATQSSGKSGPTAVAGSGQGINRLCETLPGRPAQSCADNSKASKAQQARSAWLMQQYDDRLGAAARCAAAALRGCEKPIAGLSLHAEELISAAMGGGDLVAGGPSIAECAAYLLASLQAQSRG